MNDFYRGFIRTQNKAAAQKFKGDAPLLTHEPAQKLLEYAGVLEADTVLIDVDNATEAEKLLEIVKTQALACRVLKTTRGAHFLFKDNSFASCATGATLAIGLHADIKVGTKNSYEVLKFDGKERPVLYDSGNYGAAPCWLHPVKNSPDFASMGEGDGRNDTLFRYILTLTGCGFQRQQTKETLQIINDYILAEPLPQREFDAITRDDAFPDVKTAFFEGKTFRHDKFGNFLASEMHVGFIDGQLHTYKGGCYMAGTASLEREAVHLIPTLKDSQVRETLAYIGRTAEEKKPSPPNLIAFQNGVLNVLTGQLLQATPDIVVTNQIPHEYNPAAQSEAVDNVLNAWACGDADIRALLVECAGYCLYRSNDLQKMFILTGDKANGKSTFLDFLLFTLGRENCAALDLCSVGDRFRTAQLAGKLANVGDDIADDFLSGNDVSMIKKIVTGETLTAEYKGKTPFEFSPYAKMIFSANEIPRMRDRTGAMLRRLVIVPFEADFTGSKADRHLREKLHSEAAAGYMLALAVEGLQRVLRVGHFTRCAKVSEALERFSMDNDPIKSFVAEHDISAILNFSASDIYRQYSCFCAENGYKPLSKNAFGRSFKSEVGAESFHKKMNGEVITMYRGIAG